MAHKKGVGSTDNGRDSKSKRLGVKLFGGQHAIPGNIIVRQRGTRFHPGENVYMGKDFTLHASVQGLIEFKKRRNNRTYVNVIPFDEVAETVAPKQEAPAKQAPKPAEPKPAPVAAAPAPTAEVERSIEGAEEKSAPAGKTDKITLPSGKKVAENDLKLIEGVGPKIEGLLNEAGINTWKELAEAPIEKIQEVLDNAGSRYRMHDPATWAKQASLAAEGNFDELEAYQDQLKGGKEPEE